MPGENSGDPVTNGKPKPKGNDGWGNPSDDVGNGYDSYGRPIQGAKADSERAAELRRDPSFGDYMSDPSQHPKGSHPMSAHGSGGGGGAHTNSAHGGGGHGGGNGNNASQIITFLRSKGLNDHVIAGILGNLRVESNFDPNAFNSNEGAIGIGQWEGGRRTALQNYARNHGGHETDLQMQLGYMWHELNTSEAGVLRQLRNTYSAQGAAEIWDAQYERSSGEARQTRVNYANQYDAQSLTNIQSVTNPGVYSGSTVDADSQGRNGGAGGGAGGGKLHLSAADYADALQGMAGILKAVPELQSIVQQAVREGRDTAWFVQQIEASHWYRTHNEATKTLISLKYQDPAEYKTKLANAGQVISNTAAQLGVTLGKSDLSGLVMRYLTEGWDQQTLQNQIGSFYSPGQAGHQGQAAAYYQQLQQMYGQMGVPISESSLNNRVGQLLSGKTTIDTYTEAAKTAAKSMYPSLATQIDSGMTVQDIADPYVQTYGQLLEVNPHSVTLQDPLIKKALQGTTVTGANGKAEASSTPLWQFEDRLRADPRWGKTQNAMDTVSTALTKIGQDWGFAA